MDEFEQAFTAGEAGLHAGDVAPEGEGEGAEDAEAGSHDGDRRREDERDALGEGVGGGDALVHDPFVPERGVRCKGILAGRVGQTLR
jgi:hypothetical protein